MPNRADFILSIPVMLGCFATVGGIFCCCQLFDHLWNTDPIILCQVGTKCPILHAQYDQLYPIGFSDQQIQAPTS
jgi:hypothetical protein